MKVKVRFDDQYQQLEVDREEMCDWLNIEISSGMTLSEVDDLINQRFEEMFNRQDYNCWHQFHRHTDLDARPKKGNGKRGKVVADDEGDDAVGNIGLFGDDRVDKERDRRIQDEQIRTDILRRMKPDQAKLIIAVILDEIPKQEYAAQLGISPSALSHRLDTAEKNYRNIFGRSQV